MRHRAEGLGRDEHNGNEDDNDGAPPIDLIDGPLLADKLKELKLGVRTHMVEDVEVVDEWFRTI